LSASPGIFVGLVETAVNVVCVQNGQIEWSCWRPMDNK
jgi:hypothetical protein